MDRRDLARVMFRKLLDARVCDVRRQAEQARHDDLIALFRGHAVGRDLSGSQAASARELAAAFPAEWAEALRQGALC